MLLMEITIDGTLKRISNEYLTLTHFWDAQIASIFSLKYSIKNIGGGYVEPSYGVIDLLPSLFEGLSAYPVSCGIKLMHTADTEANSVVIFEGTAHLIDIERDSIKYETYATEYDNKVTDANYFGTLISVFTGACTTLGLTLDSTYARSPSPDVLYDATGEKVIIDNLSDMAKFFSHLFYVEDSVLYLIDMLGFTTEEDLTEFDILPSGYTYNKPVSIFKTGRDATEASVDGSYSYGNEDSISPQCHTTVSNSEIALDNRKSIVESPKIRLSFPLDKVYKPGVKLLLLDKAQEITLTSEAKVRSVTWDFDNYECVVEGEGIFI